MRIARDIGVSKKSVANWVRELGGGMRAQLVYETETARRAARYASATKYRQAHPEKVWIRRAPLNLREYRWKVMLRALVAYGSDPPKCACCEETNPKFLTLSHPDNDGGAHRRAVGGSGSSMAYRLMRRKWPKVPRIIVECFNCNLGRRRTSGECPHRFAA